MLSREWRCGWSSTDRRFSNYIWAISNVIASESATYIRGMTVSFLQQPVLPPCGGVGSVVWVVGRINTLRPRQNGRHFADDIFKCIFLNESVWIPIKISLKLVPRGPINNIPALVQILAWRRPGDKPLSETMMVSLPTHICVTRPQWVILRDLSLGSISHYNDVIMSMMASQITSLTIVYSTRLFRRRSKKTSKLRVAGLFVGN